MWHLTLKRTGLMTQQIAKLHAPGMHMQCNSGLTHVTYGQSVAHTHKIQVPHPKASLSAATFTHQSSNNKSQQQTIKPITACYEYETCEQLCCRRRGSICIAAKPDSGNARAPVQRNTYWQHRQGKGQGPICRPVRSLVLSSKDI